MMPQPLSMRDVLRWVHVTLVRMGQRKEWGNLRIIVQNGQIEIVSEERVFKGRIAPDLLQETNHHEHVSV